MKVNHMHVFGERKGVPINKEVSSFQECPQRGVHCTSVRRQTHQLEVEVSTDQIHHSRQH